MPRHQASRTCTGAAAELTEPQQSTDALAVGLTACIGQIQTASRQPQVMVRVIVEGLIHIDHILGSTHRTAKPGSSRAWTTCDQDGSRGHVPAPCSWRAGWSSAPAWEEDET